MEYKQSLARRIVIAFMLMTVAVGGLFSAGIVGVVHIIEERLISRDLGGELERILRDDLAQGRNPVLDPGMRFFISDGQGSYAMPPALDQLDVGFHEVFEGTCRSMRWCATSMVAASSCCRTRAISKRASRCSTPRC